MLTKFAKILTTYVITLINRPVVAGTNLQTPLVLIFSKHLQLQTIRACHIFFKYSWHFFLNIDF